MSTREPRPGDVQVEPQVPVRSPLPPGAVFPRGPLEPDPDEIRAVTGRDADRELLAVTVAQHRLVTPRQCLCGEREPYDERDAGFHRPEWHIAHVLTALLPVVDRIANERAAAALEAAADDPDCFGPGVSVSTLRSAAAALRASNGTGTTT